MKPIDVPRTSRIPVTTPARTLLDLGAVVPVEERISIPRPRRACVEDRLLRLLRPAGLPEPVGRYRVGGVRLDVAYPQVWLGIEADSRIWHGGRHDVQRDSDKANVLLAQGWRVLRFTSGDVHRRSAYVVGAVEGALAWAA